jgi:hypothetical protein
MVIKRLIIGVWVLMMTGWVSAQPEPLHTYISDDGRFSFRYSTDLTVSIQSPQNSLNIGDFYIAEDQPLRVEVSPPMPASVFEAMGLGRTPHDVIVERMALWRQVAPLRVANLIAIPSDVFNMPLPQVIPLMVNGRAGAYVEHVYPIDEDYAVAVMMVVVDLGADTLLSFTASPSLHHGAEILAQYYADILAMIDTIAFSPVLDASMTNALALPVTYADSIGHLFTGDLTFNYPKDWYILRVGGNVFLTNTNSLLSHDVQSGMVQVNIIPPDFNQTAFMDSAVVAACGITPMQATDITPLTVLESQLLNEERLISYQSQEVTYHLPEQVTLGDATMAYVRLFTPVRDVLAVAVDMGGGHVISLMAYSFVGEMSIYDDTIFALAATLSYAPHPCDSI